MSYQALLFCPDDKTARVVTQVLTELEFTVELCSEPFAAVKKLMAQHFDAIVVDCENEQNATLLFKSARNSGSNQNSLSVAVVEGQAGVAKAFRIGANLVLTKPINVEQSKGTLRVARGLLRKADSTKPGPPSATGHSAQKPVTAFPAQKTPPSALPETPSAFDLEKEPAPQPEPAEAALLESMPDRLPGSPPAQAATRPAMGKEYPWQPVSKPFSEPMASALRRAAEAAGKTDVASASASDPKDKQSSASNMFAGQGMASAAAPAREAPHALITSEPAYQRQNESALESSFTRTPFTDPGAREVEAPTFSSLSDLQDEASDAGGGKKKFLIAVAVIVVAAGGYFGLTKMHRAGGQPAPQQQVAPAPQAATQAMTPEPQAAASAPAPSPAVPGDVSEPSASTNAAGFKPSPAKSTINVNEAPAAEPPPSEEAPEPVVVKAAPQKTVAAELVQPPAPDALGVGANADDKALSGIVSATPVSVPQPVLQTVKVSQGVSQGLLLKRVQPIYPPQAIQMRIQGAVQLQATISKEGKITNVKLLSGDSVLARAAIDAVRQWKYKPYYLNDEPVEIQTQITINFKLP
jgi:protein TonB